MKATTVKLDGELLARLEQARPETTTLSAFVRETIERDLRRRRMEKAARDYVEFLETHPDERRIEEAWEDADLVRPARRARR